MKYFSLKAVSRTRLAFAFALYFSGGLIALFSIAARAPSVSERVSRSSLYAAFPGAAVQTASEGTWSIVPSTNTTAAQNNVLSAVACVSASDCWAVGYTVAGTPNMPVGAYQTLIEHWDGTGWTIASSPNTSPTASNVLAGIACASAVQCWAVGYSAGGQALIEHWNGSAWSIVPSARIAGAPPFDFLSGVTCPSASDCWAVGYSGTSSAGVIVDQTLIEHWDGSSWVIIPSGNTLPVQHNILNGVTCITGSDCWSVGYYNAGNAWQTLAQHWDGTVWKIVSSPNTAATENNFLYSVTCNSASDCWAVAFHSTTAQTLIERWDGNSWTIVSSPNSSAYNNILEAVSCASPSECWAVGAGYSGSADHTLIERWDGGSWAIVPSADSSSTQNNALYGVACAGVSDCSAVGFYDPGTAVVQTLAEQYTAPPVTLSSVVSRKPHASAGTFDINLPLTGNPAIECRSGGAHGDYTIIFSFTNNLTGVGGAHVTQGTGSVSSSFIDSSDAHNYVVNLTAVTNAQYITISLSNVTDSAGNSRNTVSASMGILLGDTSGDGVVNSADITQTKSQSGQFVTTSNFREDVTVNGSLNSADISLVKSKSGTALP